MIQIISPTRIEVDGKDAGLPLDYFLANPDQRKAVSQAFIEWHASHVVAQQGGDAEVAAAKKALDADREALCAAHDAEKAALQADLDALGTKEEAQSIRKAQERKSKLELLAKLTAELRSDEHAELEPADAKP